MALLTQTEKSCAVAVCNDIIRSSGQTANVWRVNAMPENLFGHDDAARTKVLSNIPVEFIPASPEELQQKLDGLANVLPDTDVKTTDLLEIGPERYRVQTADRIVLFGAVTHIVLKLVRHAG